MPLEPPDQQHCQAAVGYVELGMFQDANDQLEKIDPFNRAAPEVLAVRLAIYHGLKKWELMREIAKRLADFQPNDILLNAETKFPKEAIIKYNLACYFCQMGDTENAKNYLRQAFEIDSSWRLKALDDEDLRPLWDSL